MSKQTGQEVAMDVERVGFLALSEVEGLLRRIFGCWPDKQRDAHWLQAYRISAHTVEVWRAQIEAELVAQGAMVDDGDDGALPTQSSTAKSSREGATRVGGGRHGLAGDVLVDSVCAVKIAAVDAMLQEAHAKGRRKEGDET